MFGSFLHLLLPCIDDCGTLSDMTKVRDVLIKKYEERMEVSTAEKDMTAMAMENSFLGVCYYQTKNFEEAIKHYERGLEISTTIEDNEGIVCKTDVLGNLYFDLEKFQQAIRCFEQGLKISTDIGDERAIADHSGNLGNAYRCVGKLKEALEYCKKSVEISGNIGDESRKSENGRRLGSVYFCLGEYKKAIHCYEEYSRHFKSESETAGIYGDLGTAYRCLKEYEKAIDYYEKGLKIYTDLNDKQGIAMISGNLGAPYLFLGQGEKAIEYFKKGLEISTEIGYKTGIISTSHNLGVVYCTLDVKEAIKYLEESLETSTAIGDQFEIANNNGTLGNAYRLAGNHSEALSYLTKSIKLFDTMFLHMVPDESKLSFIDKYFNFHQISMTSFFSLQNFEAALLIADLGRAKELHFCITKQRKVPKSGLLEHANVLWDRIEGKQEKQELEELEIALQNDACSTTVLFFAFDLKLEFLNVWVLNKKLTHRKLDADVTAVVLIIGLLLGMFNVSVSRDSSFFNHDIPPDADKDILSHQEMKNRKPGSKDAVDSNKYLNDRFFLQRLFQLMIDPVKDCINGQKLIIVPDKQLFFAPFSSLIDEHGCYLSHSYSIQITPSLHSLRASMEKPHDMKEHETNLGIALFVGNPAVGTVSLDGEAFTPSDLPSAAKEAESLSKLFQAKPLVGRDAQKQVVLELLEKACIIHIAAHGEPNSGKIFLAPNRSQGQSSSSLPSQESFLFTQQDIMNISVKARLVVLCCCHTGKGKVTSEGVIGTTRAFLAAGARSVLATLWPIDDAATKEFMEKFYEELCKETRVCEALRRTKNTFQNHEKQHYQSVKVWAPFTIYGEDVRFQKNEIEKIKEESRRYFDGFVILS